MRGQKSEKTAESPSPTSTFFKRDSLNRAKTYAFAVRIVNLYKHLVREEQEFVLSKQVLRSGTSVGVSVREATRAESKADFIHKLTIALKEADETSYWLELLKDTEFISDKAFQSIHADCEEIIRLLVASINSLRKSTKNQQAVAED